VAVEEEEVVEEDTVVMVAMTTARAMEATVMDTAITVKAMAVMVEVATTTARAMVATITVKAMVVVMTTARAMAVDMEGVMTITHGEDTEGMAVMEVANKAVVMASKRQAVEGAGRAAAQPVALAVVITLTAAN